jgi:hypothetical protein
LGVSDAHKKKPDSMVGLFHSWKQCLFSTAFVGTAFAGIDLDHVADFDEVSNRQLGTVL